MAIELTEKIDLKIKTQEGISVYPLIAKLVKSDEDTKELEAFEAEQEEKHKAFEEATQKGAALAKKVTRLSEDLEDLTEEIDDADEDKVAQMRKERRKLRKRLRKLEDELDAHNKEHDISSYKKTLAALVETVAKKSFDISIEENAKRDALEKAMDKYNIKYSMLIGEIGRLIGDAQKKKKRRS